jgi:hypothetical protein
MITIGADAGRGLAGWNTYQALLPLPPDATVKLAWA